MSGTSETKAVDPAGSLDTFWEQSFDQWNRQATAALEAMMTLVDPQPWQERWLEAMAESLDGFMRTPVFLEGMKRKLKATIDTKAIQDQLIQNSARQVGSPLANDITGLYERLHSHDHAILNRLKGIEARLVEIEAKLKAASPENGNGDENEA